MPAPFSADDDLPETCGQIVPQATHLATLRRDRRVLNRLLDDVERMLQGQIDGDAGFRGPGCALTLNSALSHMERTLVGTLELMRPDVCPARPLPVSREFGRRVPDAALPATVSPARF